MVVTLITLALVSWITKKLFTSGALSSKFDILRVFDKENASLHVVQPHSEKGYDNPAVDLNGRKSKSNQSVEMSKF